MGMDESLKNYKGKKTALYGLSTETQKVLGNLGNDFEIIGLLDGFREDGRLYEQPIISLDYAIQNGVELIIAVARPGSCRAIAKRIGELCRKSKIVLIDIRGRNLLEEIKTTYDFSKVSGVTKAELKKKIDVADIISFDLFDTLVVRQTLFSDDVVRYVDKKLQEEGFIIPDFYRKRMASEKELSKNRAPSLTEIYEHMLAKVNSADKQSVITEKLADLEWKLDFDLLFPRKDVCDIFRKAVLDGKKVYIVSDSYYSRSQLIQILKKCGITEYTDVISSSDYGLGKTQGLYDVLKKSAIGKSFLHIGDDIVADIESAQKHGFETCRLQSALDLLEMTGNLGLSRHMNSLCDRLRIGMFIAKLFNSPFQFERDDRHIEISDAYDVGYLICAPMISDFVLWFYEQVKRQEFKNVWFSARDGYLFKKMYSELLKEQNQDDDSVYFLTSRVAAIRAGMRDKSDFEYVDNMKFSGDLKQNLKERFGIDSDDISSDDLSDDESGLLRYKRPIMQRAKIAYKNYQKYLRSFCIKEGNVAFFDFVAKGTSQMYVQRLLHNQLKGFYFLQLEAENMLDKGLDICSFYEGIKSDLCAIYDNYYILETLLTAPHPSVQGFDEYGNPVYASETRSEKDICCFERAQEGTLDYFRTYILLCPQTERIVNRELDELLLKLIHEIKITDEDFLDLVVEDPFFNRMTNIIDVL